MTCLLWLSERFHWFGFNQHKGWTVLIAVAAVGVAALVMLLWWAAGLIFHWRFQFGIRSLLVFCLSTSIAAGWLAVEMRRARRQADVVTPIRNSNAWETYDWQFDADGRSTGNSEPPWPRPLWKTLGIDFFSVVVVIHYTDATDAGLENLKELTQLRELSLDSTKVTDAGLAHLNQLNELRYLGISYTDVTDAGLEQLKGLPKLRDLDLSGTHVTDAGLEYFKELTLLVLGSTRITDAGLEHVKEMPRLRVLSLGWTNVTDAGLENLKGIDPTPRLGPRWHQDHGHWLGTPQRTDTTPRVERPLHQGHGRGRQRTPKGIAELLDCPLTCPPLNPNAAGFFSRRIGS